MVINELLTIMLGTFFEKVFEIFFKYDTAKLDTGFKKVRLQFLKMHSSQVKQPFTKCTVRFRLNKIVHNE